MPRIKIFSDLHLEFGLVGYNFSECDVVVFAGDVFVGTQGIEWILDSIPDIPVVYVLGNHEYYKHAYPKLLLQVKDIAAGSNVFVLENESVEIDGAVFHGATLWTDFKLFGDPVVAGFHCQQRMNDYSLIRRNPSYSKMRSLDTYQIHQSSKNWLEESLTSSKSAKNIVVTHHAPSLQSVPPEYKDNMLSAAFASNLEGLILKHQPNLWVHGHIHTASDYFINETRVVCNPSGYPGEEIAGFVANRVIEV